MSIVGTRRSWRGALRVASFNVRNGRAFDGCRSWPCRRRAVVATIEALDADVLGLQEVFAFQMRWLRRRLPAYDAVWVGRDDGRRGEGCPCSCAARSGGWRRPERSGSAPAPSGRAAPRRREVPPDRHHLPARADLRARARRHLHPPRRRLGRPPAAERRAARHALARDVPQIVVGDLNARPGDGVVAVLAAAGLRDTLPADAPGTLHGFTARRDGPRIDYVLVDGGSRSWTPPSGTRAWGGASRPTTGQSSPTLELGGDLIRPETGRSRR